MSDPAGRRPIRVLPSTVATRIAAGEVIERPASVVKELVENALDAGANQIRIDVRGGGLSLIRVGDDGIGIPEGELYLACQRHATSKLPDDDLRRVRTLGFRGEALPSIAAVAELELVSAAEDGGVGRRLVLCEGKVVADEPAPRPRGTTATVRHLFQNVPVRLATGRRIPTEIAQIGQTIRRLALAAPAVRLTLVADDRPVLQTSGSGDLRATLIEVYGPTIAPYLIEIDPREVEGARVWGIIVGSEVTRPGRDQVNLIVNGRWTQPRGLLALLEAAYRPLLPRGRQPVLAVQIDVPSSAVDVNIHPAKQEVRLLAERTIGMALADLVRNALGQRPLALRLPPASGLAALGAPPAVAEARGDYDEDSPILTPGLPPLRLVGQVQDRLLLLEGQDGLYLVDQHRAHERIIFERLSARHGASAPPEPVVLPDPLILELRPAQVARFARRLDELAALGFQCEAFGGRTFLLRAAPSLPGVFPSADERLVGLGDPAEALASLLALADEDVASEGWQERLLIRLSCRSALRRGRSLERPVMRALVEGLGHTVSPAVCPHGSPLLMHVSAGLLEQQFHWK